ncbi:MAG: hypothetical protein GY773_15565 [Actinomycetia bacterium]|nr:hypothetical protein [Actinomycetes bacterium]
MDIINPTEGSRQGSSKRKARSKTRRYMAGAALLVGGLTAGALFSPIGLASADDDATTSDDTSSSTDETQDPRLGHHGHRGQQRGNGGEDMAELLGITVDELKAGFEDGKTLAEMAEANGVSVDDLTAHIVAQMQERLDEAVADGKIDQETADERLAGAEERAEEFVNSEPGSRPGRDGGHRHGPGPRGGDLDAVAEDLGLSIDELKASLADGQTLAEAAAAQGVEQADLVAALVEEAQAKIDEAVANGRLTEDKAAEVKATLEEKITERVNNEPGERGSGEGFVHSHPHRHGGPGGPDGDGGPGADGEVQDSSFTA